MDERDSLSRPEAGTPLLDAAVVVAENLRLLIFGSVAAGVIALAISFFIPPTFTATARLLPPAPQNSLPIAQAALVGAIATAAGGSISIKNPGDQLVAIMKSRTVFDAIIDRFDLKTVYQVPLMVEARAQLDRHARLVSSPKDGVVSIEVDDHDPKRAAQIANAFVDELHRVTHTLAVGEAAQRRLFYENQLKRQKEELTRAEQALRGSGIGEGALKADVRSSMETLARLTAQVSAQEVRLASMRTYMTESNPAYRVASEELAALQAQVFRLDKKTVGRGDSAAPDYISSFRDFKYHETLFELLLRQYDVARMEEARDGMPFQVLDPAQPPEKKSKPSKASIAVLTTLCAFILLFVFVFAQRAWQQASSGGSSAEKIARLQDLLHLWRR